MAPIPKYINKRESVTDILDLLAHLLDEYLQLSLELVTSALIDFDAGVRFTVELLHHKVETATHSFFLLQNVIGLFNVRSRRSSSSATSIRCAISTSSCSRRLFSSCTSASSSLATGARAATGEFPAYERELRHFAAHAHKPLLDKRFQAWPSVSRATMKSSSAPSRAARSAAMASRSCSLAAITPTSADINPLISSPAFSPVGSVYQLFSQLFVEDEFTLSAGICSKRKVHSTLPRVRRARMRSRTTALDYGTAPAGEARFQIALVYRAQPHAALPPVTLISRRHRRSYCGS